jgi:hypothetical protein
MSKIFTNITKDDHFHIKFQSMYTTNDWKSELNISLFL